MKIEIANIDEIDDILQIEHSSFTDPWSKSSFEEAINSDNITVYSVTNDNGNMVGFSCLLMIDYDAEILNIAGARNSRNQGIGTLLATHMINICRSNGVEDIFLEVRESNVSARALYVKLGFAEIGKRKKYYSNPTEDAILMKLSLN